MTNLILIARLALEGIIDSNYNSLSKKDKDFVDSYVKNEKHRQKITNNINNFHSKLKQFMSRFNGVATKYLDNYVNYFNDIRNRIDYFNQLLQLQGCYRLVDLRKRKVCFESGMSSI